MKKILILLMLASFSSAYAEDNLPVYKAAIMSLMGSSFSIEEQKRVLELLQPNDLGSTEAQYKLGLIFLSEKFAAKNAKKGIHLLRLSAEQGYSEAQYAIAIYYSMGKAVEQDYAEAFNWFKKAAKNNHAKAIHNLALSYLHGLGVDKSITLARKWLAKASDRGNLKSALLLSKMKGRHSKKETVVAPQKVNKGLKSTKVHLKKNVRGNLYQVVSGLTWFKKAVSKKGYILQLLVASNEHTVEQFLNDYQISNDYMHYIKTTNKGSNTHVVLHGRFDSYQQALGKAKELSHGFTRFKPWVRSMASVRKKELLAIKLASRKNTEVLFEDNIRVALR